MIDTGDYQLAWQAYLGCGILATVLWFFLLRRLPGVFLRYWLLLAAVAFFFTPIRHPEVAQLWVPASVASVLSLVTEGLESAMPILIILAAGQLLAIILSFSLHLWLAKPTATSSTGAAHQKSAGPAGTRKASISAAAQRQEPTLTKEEPRS